MTIVAAIVASATHAATRRPMGVATVSVGGASERGPIHPSCERLRPRLVPFANLGSGWKPVGRAGSAGPVVRSGGPIQRSDMTSASASERLRAASDRIWQGLHAHPFITELAGGTLPIDKFRFFLEQDNLYLQDYARCLAMGAAKSRNEVELRYFVTDLNQVIEKELPSNRELLERVTQMGALDRGGAWGMAPANVAYTSYMRSLASHGGPLEIMASLLPCAWSY